MLDNQTFEILQPMKRTVYTIPFTYFTYLSHSRHLNHLISEILEQRNNVYLYIENISTNSKAFQLWCESFNCLTAVELPSMSCLRPVRTCFFLSKRRQQKILNQKIKLTFACPPFVRTRTDAGKFSFAVDTGSSIQTRRACAFIIICFTKEKFLNFCVYWALARFPL